MNWLNVLMRSQVKINEAKELLTLVYMDWSHILANPSGIRKDSQITWNGYVPKMLKMPVMISDVMDLAENGQYTFQIVEDGSIIQLFYQYKPNGNDIQAASLAFYSSVVHKDKAASPSQAISEVESNGEGASDEDTLDEESQKESDEQIPVSSDRPANWLRIDYDPHHAMGVLHHDCHMHLSAFPDARLVVAGIPTPKQFIEFIIALCYPKSYAEHRLDANGMYNNENHIMTVNSKCPPSVDHKVFSQIAHFRIPVIADSHRR